VLLGVLENGDVWDSFEIAFEAMSHGRKFHGGCPTTVGPGDRPQELLGITSSDICATSADVVDLPPLWVRSDPSAVDVQNRWTASARKC
jgi:hypothetical protein